MLYCVDVHCKIAQQLCIFYEDIVKVLKLKSHQFYNFPKCNSQCRPGWNVHVADLQKDARDAFLLQKEQGKPRQGPTCEMKKRANACFKYAIRYIKYNENAMRKATE